MMLGIGLRLPGMRTYLVLKWGALEWLELGIVGLVGCWVGGRCLQIASREKHESLS